MISSFFSKRNQDSMPIGVEVKGTVGFFEENSSAVSFFVLGFSMNALLDPSVRNKPASGD